MTTPNQQPSNLRAVPPAPPKRMSLDGVKKGRIEQPLRVLLYGPEGIGKSTFGAASPAAVFLGAEDGTGELDVARMPEPRTWQDVLDGIRELATQPHEFKTLVIDTLDWLEPFVWRHVCEKHRKPDIESFGYGKGYVAALDEWRMFVGYLEHLRRAKGMHVILLAHAHARPYKNPEGDDYDRWTLKVHEKAGGLLKEWVDAVLFANYETLVAKNENGRAKGYRGGARWIHAERRAAFDAKNRFGLPEKFALSWPDFFTAVRGSDTPEVRERLRGELTASLPKVADEKKRTAIESWLSDTSLSAAALRGGINRVTALIAETLDSQQSKEVTE